MSMSLVVCVAMLIVIPAVMVFFGAVRKNLAGKIGGKFGYKTELSMTSQEAWDFAQKACVTRYVVGGIAIAAGTAWLMSLAMGVAPVAFVVYSLTVVLFQCLALACVTMSVEMGLRKLLGVKDE